MNTPLIKAFVLYAQNMFDKINTFVESLQKGTPINTKGEVKVSEMPSVEISNFPEKLSVDTGLVIPDIQKVEVLNLPKQEKYPESLLIDQRQFEKIEELLAKQKVEATNDTPKAIEIPINKGPKEYVNVRLTNGKNFIEAFWGGGGVVIPFETSDGKRKAALVSEDGKLQVDIVSMPNIAIEVGDIQIGAVEIKDSTTDNRLTVTTDGEILTKINAFPLLAELIDTNIHTTNKELRVFQENHICAENTTATPLGANQEFVGDWQDALNFAEIRVSLFSDRDSTTDGVKFQWSNDGVNEITGVDDHYTLEANKELTWSSPRNWRYFRVKFTNGNQAQNTLYITTQMDRVASKGSSHRLKDSLKQEDDAIVTKSLIAGFSTAGGGSLVNVKVNPSGAIQVDGTIAVTSDTTADPLAKYSISDKDDDASPNYYGFVASDGSWYIMRETVVSGGDTYRYCKGNSDYATSWTNRASLTYNYFDIIF